MSFKPDPEMTGNLVLRHLENLTKGAVRNISPVAWLINDFAELEFEEVFDERFLYLFHELTAFK